MRRPIILTIMCMAVDKEGKILVINRTKNGCVVKEPLNSDQKEMMRKAIDLMCGVDINNEEMKSAFWIEWEKYPVLSLVRKWWNNLPVHFEISPVGVALSNAYIHSKDPSVPCLY